MYRTVKLKLSPMNNESQLDLITKKININEYYEKQKIINSMCSSLDIDKESLENLIISKIIEDCKRHDKDQWKEVIEKYVFSDDFIYIIHEGIQLNICTILTKPKPLVRKLLKYIKEVK